MRNRSVQLAAAVALALASTIAAAQVSGAGTTRATTPAGTASANTTTGTTSADTTTGTTTTTVGGCRGTGGSTCTASDSNTSSGPSTSGTGTTTSSSASDFSQRVPANSSGVATSGSSGASGSATATNQTTTDANTANTGTIATPATTGFVGVLPGDTGFLPNGERVVNSNTVVAQPPAVTVYSTPLLDATTKEAQAREQSRRRSGNEPRVIGIAPRTDADLTHQMPDDRIIRY